MDKEIVTITLPIISLSNVLMNWSVGEERKNLLISPVKGNDDECLVQTRDIELAAAIVKDVPVARVQKQAFNGKRE